MVLTARPNLVPEVPDERFPVRVELVWREALIDIDVPSETGDKWCSHKLSIWLLNRLVLRRPLLI